MSPKKDSDPSAPLVRSSEEDLDVEENEALDEGLEDKSDWPAHLDVQIKESKGRLSYLAGWLDKRGYVKESEEVFRLLSLPL